VDIHTADIFSYFSPVFLPVNKYPVHFRRPDVNYLQIQHQLSQQSNINITRNGMRNVVYRMVQDWPNVGSLIIISSKKFNSHNKYIINIRRNYGKVSDL
jgi:hypothetical protein